MFTSIVHHLGTHILLLEEFSIVTNILLNPIYRNSEDIEGDLFVWEVLYSDVGTQGSL